AWYLMAFAIVLSTPVQAGEEIGWRGYALPRMAARMGLAGSSILLGLIWAFWHLPFFLIPGSDNYGRPLPAYVVSVTAISVTMAWLHWHTDESLLPVMVMHAAIDNTAGIVVSPPVRDSFAVSGNFLAWITACLLWLNAFYCLIQMRKAKLHRP